MENMNSLQEKALKSQRKAARILFIYNIIFTIAAVAVGFYSFTII